MGGNQIDSNPVHAEQRMGLGLAIGRTRVARLMRDADIHGVSHHRKRCHSPDTATREDLARRRFAAQGPDRVWFADIERHEVLLNRAVVKGDRLRLAAASRVKLGAA